MIDPKQSQGDNIAPHPAPIIRGCRPEDLLELSETMRQGDVDELRHVGTTPLEALLLSAALTTYVFTIERAGRVVAIFGVSEPPGRHATPWMLATDELQACRRLLRECRSRLDAYLLEFGHLANAVWSKNTLHIRWLRRLGFTFTGESTRDGERFLHFHRNLQHV